MRGLIVGIIIGSVVGVMFGATIIAPRLDKADVRSAVARAGGGEPIAADAAAGPRISITKPSSAPQRPVRRWRLASAWPKTLPPMGKLAARFVANLWNVSGGGLGIKLSGPGVLTPVNGMFDAVAAGTIDAAFGSPGIWAKKAPALELFAAVPFGPPADEYLAWMYFGGGLAILESVYNKFNIQGIPCGMTPPGSSGWFRRQFTSPEDLRGLRLRSSGLAAMVWSKLGVRTVRLAGEDVFNAFENGDIDAAESSLPSVDLKLGYQDIANNYYFPGWQRPATLLNLIINKGKWDSLSKSRQSQIEAVCGDNLRYGLAQGEAMQYAALKEFTAKGVKIRRWPEPVLAALRTAWGQVQAEQSAADAGFRRVWRSLENFRKNYSVWKELSRP